MSWKDDAACLGDGRNWFPDEIRAPRATARLVEVCEGCRVSRECLTAAMDEEAGMVKLVGVRGGLTARERASLRRMPRMSA